MDKKAYFVSDLHLFCDRSIANQHVSDFRVAANKAHTFILGGDIFDFKWSRLGTIDRSIGAARAWIEDFIHPFPECQFHYLLGNHDCGPPFTNELESLAQSASNFNLHPYFLRIGNSFFLHGDVTDKWTDQSALEAARNRWALETPRGSTANSLYNFAISLRIHRLAARIANPVATVAERLLYYMKDVGHGPESGVSDVFFGHTHLQVLDFELQGVRFHNGGAPIKGLPFRMLTPEIPSSESNMPND